MKKLNFLFGLLFVASLSQAQEAQVESKWKYKGQTGINFTQTSFSNWSAGGENSYSLVWTANLGLDYTGEKANWNNSLDLGYGLTKQGEQDIRKMVDKIDLLSKYSILGFSDKWRYTALLNFKTQFADGFDYKSANQQIFTSTFLAPGYLTGSFGMEYMGGKHLKVFISPLSQKTTLISEAYYDKKVENHAVDGYVTPEGEPQIDLTPAQIQEAEDDLSTTTTYGLAWRENSKIEMGALAQIIYDNPEIAKNIGFKTRLDLFGAYSDITKVDIDWEAWITFKFNKFLSMNINTQLIYDDDIKFQENFTGDDGNPGVKNIPKIQFRELFGIGITYTFN